MFDRSPDFLAIRPVGPFAIWNHLQIPKIGQMRWSPIRRFLCLQDILPWPPIGRFSPGFWQRLKRSKARIEAVATDMAGGYIAAALEHLQEAINGKIGTLQRNVRGYRDDEYLKLRIFDLHNKTYALTG